MARRRRAKAQKRRRNRFDGTKLFPYKSDEQGRPLCRFCDRRVKYPRRTFCSDKCVHDYKICTDPATARKAVFKRDQGVCARCSLDTEKLLSKVISRASKSRFGDELMFRFERVYKFVTANNDSYWENDHIVPVAKGGAKLGLKNMQTLCIPCHRNKSVKDNKS